MALKPVLIELLIVEATEFQRQSSQTADQPGVRGDHGNDETEAGLLRKLKAAFGFTLRLNQRISSGEKVRVQVIAAISRKCQVTDSVRCVESATHQIAASPDMFRPWHD